LKLAITLFQNMHPSKVLKYYKIFPKKVSGEN